MAMLAHGSCNVKIPGVPSIGMIITELLELGASHLTGGKDVYTHSLGREHRINHGINKQMND